MTVERITFQVGNDTLVGNLHLPTINNAADNNDDGNTNKPFSAVIVGGPMTSVKEQVTGTYAAAIAKNSGGTVAALAIDHRHYGESDGEPRQYEFYEHKIQDLKGAIDALKAHPKIDATKIGAVGVCLGCGYMAHAIESRADIKAFCAVAGYYRNVPEMKQKDPQGFEKQVQQGVTARRKYQETGIVDVIPAVALPSTEGDAAMKLQSTYDYYAGRAMVDNYKNEFAVMSREHFLRFNVQSAAPGITMPFLQVHGPNALNPKWAQEFFTNVPSTNKDYHEIRSEGQTDIYDDPAIVHPVSIRIIEFVQTYGLWRR